MYELGKDRLTFLEDMDGYVLSYREHCSKPDPEIYIYTMKKMGVEPKDCYVVEDSTFGLQAAESAGAVVICKRDDRFGYDQSGADYYIDRLAEIEDICLGK